MSRLRVTLADVAREAGVSLTTVSHALNEKGRVDAVTREKVQSVANRLRYVPNRAARALSRGETSQLGLTFPHLGNLDSNEFFNTDWYGNVVLAASRAAFSVGESLMYLPDTTESNIRRSGATCLLITDPLRDDERIEIARSLQIPFVLIGSTKTAADCASVEPDLSHGFSALLTHFRERGAKNTLLIGTDVNWDTGLDRLTRDLIATAPEGHQIRRTNVNVMSLETRGEMHQAAKDAALEALQSANPPDSIIGLFEGFGRSAIAAAHEANLAVGSDILIAQDTDGLRARLARPAVTTLDLRLDDQFAAAILLSQELAEGSPGRNIVTPVDLKVRGSSDPSAQSTGEELWDL